MNDHHGFSFIEVLIVTAIVGILVSVTVVTMNKSRDKSRDSGIQAELSIISAQAELYFVRHSDRYNQVGAPSVDGVACPGVGQDQTLLYDPIILASLKRAIKNSGASTAYCYVAADGSAYAIQIPRRSNQSAYYCVDATGVVAITSIVFSGATTRCGT